ncbi:MAG: thermonuclease family protein [Candidatus Nitrospinota bacterium M3_3B_026]
MVKKVFDGDTLLVLIGGREEKVRLLGIDTPETDGPYTSLEPLGEEAKERAAELALGKKVGLVYGGTTLRDKYGRLLAYVHLPDGRVLNEALLEEGLAEAYRRFSHPRKSFYVYLEWKAWVERKGIWGPADEGRPFTP